VLSLDSGVLRDEVFITTKFLSSRDPVAEAEQSLRRLGLDWVDLYLVHWPIGGPVRAWPGMERSRELGPARSIGISNFGLKEMETVIAAGTTPPAIRWSSIPHITGGRWPTGAGSRGSCPRFTAPWGSARGCSWPGGRVRTGLAWSGCARRT
jgi:Aldo/keto reductase family